MTPTNVQSDIAGSETTIRDGAEMKRVLKVAGYSQKEIGQYAGFSRSHINNMCNGFTPLSLRVVEAIRSCLGERLFNLAIERSRQLEADELERKKNRQTYLAEQAEKRKQEELLRAEVRRQEAISLLTDQLDNLASDSQLDSIDGDFDS